MREDSVRQWANAYKTAWETADSDAAAGLFTEDGTYRANIYENAYRGRSGVIEYWTGVTGSQSDVSVAMGEPFIDGSRAVVEFWTNMKVGGEPLTLAGALLLEFTDDGLCRSLREYWNVQEGDADPPEGWGT